MLEQPFEYEFHAGAAGQVGYTLYVQRRPRDGHNLLFGNMGPEMIMYATQKPTYKFPQDFIYFCRTDIDNSCVFVRRDSAVQGRQVDGRGGEEEESQRRAQPHSPSGDDRHDGARPRQPAPSSTTSRTAAAIRPSSPC